MMPKKSPPRFDDARVDAVRRALTTSVHNIGKIETVDSYCERCGHQLQLVPVDGFSTKTGRRRMIPACRNRDCCVGGGCIPAPLNTPLRLLQWLFRSRTCARCGECYVPADVSRRLQKQRDAE
jgi:hypothetical protein